jgi:DNA-binding MarR family transcriptional regulator
MYGYEITQKVKELTQDDIQITEGALYPILHKLEAEEVLTAELEKVDGRTRKYYKITPKGNAVAVDRIAEPLPPTDDDVITEAVPLVAKELLETPDSILTPPPDPTSPFPPTILILPPVTPLPADSTSEPPSLLVDEPTTSAMLPLASFPASPVPKYTSPEATLESPVTSDSEPVDDP